MHASTSSPAPHISLSHVSSYSDCIDAAMVCCVQAREAARCGRMAAADGLLQTAVTLYNRAEKESGLVQNSETIARFERLVNDLCFAAQMIEVEQIERQPQSGAVAGGVA